jgi:pimeloyl-ACP methyl ester carboxylesterase
MRSATEAKVKFPEASVFVRELGDGPPLLLIGGIGAHTAMWEPLERVLGGFRIVEFDLPGAGQSEVPWKPISVPRLARLAMSVMDKFGIERADVLGHSMGGIVAQQLAADSPERVRRLVLVSTSPGVGSVYGDFKAMLNIATPLRYLTPALYQMSIGSLVGGRARHDKEWVAEQGKLRRIHAPSWRGYLGQLLSLSTWSGLPLLARIEHPALVLAGDDDPLTPPANGMLLTHLLPRGRLIVFPGEGHLMLMDDDSRSHAAILDFLEAEPLDQSAVWQEASTVDAEELKTAVAGKSWQLPPMSVVGALVRRRWLSSAGNPDAASNSG